MSNDDYELKTGVIPFVLDHLNSSRKNGFSKSAAICSALSERLGWPSDEDLYDWIDALKSGKKIVNPIPPRKELITRIHDVFGSNVTEYANGFYRGAYAALECAAKEHPAIKDWLRADSADIADWSKGGDYDD